MSLTAVRAGWSARRAAMFIAAGIAVWLANAAVLLPVLALLALIIGLEPRWTIGTRIAAAIPILITWILAVTLVLQPIGLGLHPLATWLPLLLLGARRPIAERTNDWPSLAPWLLAMAALLFLASAAVFVTDGTSRGIDQRLAIMAGSEDAASHYAIYDTILFADGYAFGADAKRHSVQWSYPPGFHMAAAVLARTLDDTVGTNELRGGHFDAFWLACIGALAMLVGAASWLGYVLSRRWGSHWLVGTSAAIATAGAMVFWLPFDLMAHGFFPQLVALAMLCVVIGVLADEDPGVFRGQLLVAAAALAAITATWYFLTPIVGIVVAIWLILRRAQVIAAWRLVAAFALGALVLGCYPVVKSVGAGSLTAVNAGGGVTAVPGLPLIALCIAAACLMVLVRAHRFVWLALATPVVFALAFLTYQELRVGNPAYFYYKSLYTPLVFAIAIAFAGIAAIAVRPGRRPWLAAVAGAGLVLTLASLIGIRPDARETSMAWRYRDGGLKSAHRVTFARYLEHRNDVRGRYLLAWKLAGDPTVDYFGTRWLTAFNARTTRDYFDFLGTQVYQQDLDALATFVSDHPREVTLFTNDRNLRRKLERAGVEDDALDEHSIIVG